MLSMDRKIVEQQLLQSLKAQLTKKSLYQRIVVNTMLCDVRSQKQDNRSMHLFDIKISCKLLFNTDTDVFRVDF